MFMKLIVKQKCSSLYSFVMMLLFVCAYVSAQRHTRQSWNKMKQGALQPCQTMTAGIYQSERLVLLYLFLFHKNIHISSFAACLNTSLKLYDANSVKYSVPTLCFFFRTASKRNIMHNLFEHFPKMLPDILGILKKEIASNLFIKMDHSVSGF